MHREESSNPSSSSSSKERTTAKKDKGDKSKEPRTARKHKLFSQVMEKRSVIIFLV